MRMNLPRVLLIIASVFTAFILQSCVLSRLGLPGATPNLVLVVVIAIAMAAGPGSGAIVGFSAGVLVDIAPPATGSLGQSAAVFAVAAYIAGHVQLERGLPDLRVVGTVAALSAGVTVALVVSDSLVGSGQFPWSALPSSMLSGAVYAGLLSLIFLPAISGLYRGAIEETGFA